MRGGADPEELEGNVHEKSVPCEESAEFERATNSVGGVERCAHCAASQPTSVRANVTQVGYIIRYLEIIFKKLSRDMCWL